MGLFLGASEKKSSKTKSLIIVAISQVIEDLEGYTIVYGNFRKKGIITEKIFNYVIAFKSEPTELVILPIDSDGNVAGEALYLNDSSISSIKKYFHGSLKISTSLINKPVQISVIPFTVDSLENCHLMPINQKEEYAAFMQFIKRFK